MATLRSRRLLRVEELGRHKYDLPRSAIGT
jgi:hypothetical protein